MIATIHGAFYMAKDALRQVRKAHNAQLSCDKDKRETIKIPDVSYALYALESIEVEPRWCDSFTTLEGAKGGYRFYCEDLKKKGMRAEPFEEWLFNINDDGKQVYDVEVPKKQESVKKKPKVAQDDLFAQA